AVSPTDERDGPGSDGRDARERVASVPRGQRAGARARPRVAGRAGAGRRARPSRRGTRRPRPPRRGGHVREGPNDERRTTLATLPRSPPPRPVAILPFRRR